MKKRIIILTAISLICAFLVGCMAPEPVGDPSLVKAMGRWNDKTYTNDYFDISLSAPADWTIFTDEQMQQAIDAGNQAVAGDNQDLLKQAEQAKDWTANLMMVSDSDFEKPSNANVNVTAEMLDAYGGVFGGTDQDFLSVILSGIKQIQKNATLSPIKTVKLGNTSFATSSISLDVAGTPATQDIYVKASEGYLLIINAVYKDDAGKKVIDAMLQTIKTE